jgi:dimethylaniline monooxygenase (N-oxide forming)
MNLKQIRTSHFRNTYGTKNSGLAEAILYYGCTIKPEIKLIKEHSIIFGDDSEEYIDEIVCCTGFENNFIFLDSVEDDRILKQVGHEARISHNLYKHAIHPLTGDSLIFIGFVRPCFGAVPPLAEMQARWFALLCSGKCQLPDAATMNSRIGAYVRYITRLFTPFRTKRITTLTDFLSFSDDLAREIGCRPNLGLTMLLFDSSLWLRCMIGPISNAQYRLFGPHANFKQARQVLMKMKWKPIRYNFFELILFYISTLLWFCGIRNCQPHAWCSIHERNI